MFATGIGPGCDRSDPASPANNLEALRDQLQRVVDVLDPNQLTPAVAVGVAGAFAAIERLAAAGKVLAATRAAEAKTPEVRVHRTPARWLASLSGMSVVEAQELLSAGERLVELPATETALRAGCLSGAQLRAVVDGAIADPGSEQSLLGAASSESLYTLQQAAESAKATARSAEEDAARHARAHARRGLRCTTHGDGSFSIEGQGSAVDGLTITRALRLEHERLFREAAARGERPTYAALSWDALASLASLAQRQYGGAAAPADRCPDAPAADAAKDSVKDTTPAPKPVRSGAAVKTIVRVDYETLCRGHLLTGETCEVAGLGPLPVAAVRELLAEPNTFLAAVLTKGQQVLGVAHLGRGPNAHQRTALEWLTPTCSVPGCDNTVLEWDHDVDYSVCKETELANLIGDCGPHHTLKTAEDWRHEPGTGKRRFLPPGHPDHPGDPRPGRPKDRGPPPA